MIINVLYYLLRYEPNTPLAFRQRDVCHLKQQAGHGKIAVEFGHGTKDSISRIADYDTWILLIVPQKNRSGLYPSYYFEKLLPSEQKRIKDTHCYLSGKSSPKHTELFGRTLYNSTPWLLDMMLIFVSPILELGLSCL